MWINSNFDIILFYVLHANQLALSLVLPAAKQMKNVAWHLNDKLAVC